MCDSNEMYQRLFNDAPVAYHVIDREGKIVCVNRFECELLGYPPDRMLGRPVWEFVSPDQRDDSREAVRRKLAGLQPLERFERTYQQRSGSPVVFEIHENRVEEHARLVGIRSAMIDITQQKELESRLRSTQEWLHGTLRSVPEPLIAIDAAGMITFANAAASSLTGWPAEDAIGRDLADVLPVVDRSDNTPMEFLMTRLLREGMIRDLSGTKALVGRCGVATLIELSCSAIVGEDAVVLGAVLTFRRAAQAWGACGEEEPTAGGRG